MLAMTKEEMIRYLRDYAVIEDRSIHNQDTPLWTIFIDYMIKANRPQHATREYYDRMRNTYCTYCTMKIFSFGEDYLLNQDEYLRDSDLDSIKDDLISKYSLDNLSNKQIVRLIRNAFNHDDDPHFEKFRISVNGKNIEIRFKDIRKNKEKALSDNKNPVCIKIPHRKLLEIKDEIASKKLNALLISYKIPEDFNILSNDLDKEIDKIKLIHYYIDRKLTEEELKEMSEFGDLRFLSNEEKEKMHEKFHEFSNRVGRSETYNLNLDQKDKLKEFITRYKETGWQEYLEKQYVTATMYYFLNKVIPIPLMKTLELKNQIILTGLYQHDSSFSQKEVRRRIRNILTLDEVPEYYDETDKLIHDSLKEKDYPFVYRLLQDASSPESMQLFPIITYIDSVITHYCDEDKITIDNKTYDKEKIRNSFVHGRWFISKDYELVMYDADPKNKNDYNLNYIGKINIDSFFGWTDKYLYTKFLNQKTNQIKNKYNVLVKNKDN